MKITRIALLSFAFAASAAFAQPHDDENRAVTLSTVATTPLVIEGLTNDDAGNLYAPGRSTTPGTACPVWRTPAQGGGALTIVGLVPAPASDASCSPSGLAFGPDGQLYVTQTDRIYRFLPSATSAPTATLFVSGVPGTNGLAFDRDGNLWTGDGTTGQGRVWKITPAAVVTEMFRIQPMANELNPATSSGVINVGRDVRTLPPGGITVNATSRNANNTAGSQPLVANGLAFDGRGNLFVADTARGAIWRVRIAHDGGIASEMGCDSTFTANTLCMQNIYVAHPLLDGVDGIVLDVAGNIWGSANERNAIVFVARGGAVYEVYRNKPDAGTRLRNAGPLESPASPVLVGHRFCTSNSDGNRRDNSPATAGEIGGAGQPRGKINCIDQRISIPGMRLPLD